MVSPHLRRRLAACVALASAALYAPDGAAQPAPELAAQAHFDRGLRLADRGQWSDAIEAFERARALAPLPAVLFNLAEARRRANRTRAALDAYIEYLARASAASQFRAVAMQRVVELERRVARLRFDVSPPEAVVRVDDRDLDDATQITLDPGPHAIVVRAPGYEPEARTMTLDAGERVTLAVHLARAQPVAAPIFEPPPAPPPPPSAPPPPAPESTYRYAFQLAAVTHAILDDGSIGFGVGARLGMRVARSWELLVGLSRDRTNGVGYVVGGVGFFYVSHAASPIAVYMGSQLGVIVPQCTTNCTYTSSGAAAQTDLTLLVTAGARFEITRWFGPFLELNGGIARLSDPGPLVYFGTGVQFALPM